MAVEVQSRIGHQLPDTAGPTKAAPDPYKTEEDQPIRVTSLARLAPLIVFVTASLLTILMVVQISTRISSENAVASERVSDVLARDIESRVAVYTEALIGIQGFHESSDSVSRIEFNHYMRPPRSSSGSPEYKPWSGPVDQSAGSSRLRRTSTG